MLYNLSKIAGLSLFISVTYHRSMLIPYHFSIPASCKQKIDPMKRVTSYKLNKLCYSVLLLS